jgi:hypothetical protein
MSQQGLVAGQSVYFLYLLQVRFFDYARHNPKPFIAALVGLPIYLKATSYLLDSVSNFVSPYMESTANFILENAQSVKGSFTKTQVGQWFSRNIYNITAPSKQEAKRVPTIIRELVTHTIKQERSPTFKEITDATLQCTLRSPLMGILCFAEALQPRVDVRTETYFIEYVKGEEPLIPR